MVKQLMILMSVLFFSLFSGYAQAQIPFSRGPLGNVCINIGVTSSAGTSKLLRMVLDTGSSVTIFDKSVPDIFWSKSGDSGNVQGRTEIIKAEKIKIREIAVFGKEYHDINGIRLDLSGYSRFDDLPIDGVIGMDILKDMAFGLDLEHDEILLKKPELPGVKNNISMSDLGCPEVNIGINNKIIKTRFDTGSNSFLVLSVADSMKIGGGVKGTVGIEQGISSTSIMKSESLSNISVSNGAVNWHNLNVTIGNGPSSLLGINSCWPKVWLDFPKMSIWFFTDPSGGLQAETPVKMPIHVYWDRSTDPACLKIFAIKPNSIFGETGLNPGDTILGINGFTGNNITISNFKITLLSGAPIELTVKRNGKIHKINIPPYSKIN